MKTQEDGWTLVTRRRSPKTEQKNGRYSIHVADRRSSPIGTQVTTERSGNTDRSSPPREQQQTTTEGTIPNRGTPGPLTKHAKDYIASFEEFLVKMEWERDKPRAISMFKHGIPDGLFQECLRHRPRPITLTEWMNVVENKEKAISEWKLDLAKNKKRKADHLLEGDT